MKYIVYYKLKTGDFRVLHSDDDNIETYNKLPDIKRKFFMFKGYDVTDDGLRKYNKDFEQWTNEIKKNSVYNIRYTYYFSHHIAVETVFKKLSLGKFESITEVTKIEHQYMNLCNNGGLTYCETYEGECFGYDFNAYYPRVLSSNVFKIPITDGEECYTDIYKCLTKSIKLKYGFYYISITSTNPNAKKVFSFSKHDVYTHYSIEFAYKHRKQFNFEFAFYCEEEGFNCYVYEDENLVTGNEIFGNWFKQLADLRKLFPKNKLLKHLLSSIWGHLCKNKSIMRTYEQIQEEALDVGHDEEAHYKIQDHIINDSNDYYVLYNNHEPYHYGLARMKAFLTSYGRNRTATIALNDIDNVIRIHTDNVTFTKAQDLSKTKNISLEDKTTGYLKWNGKVNQLPERINSPPV